MDELDNLIDNCAVAATRIQADDLVALAQLHGSLQSTLGALADNPSAFAVAQKASELVEKLVLGDAPNPDETRTQVIALTNRLLRISRDDEVNGSPVPGHVGPAGAAADIEPPSSQSYAEHAIAADDVKMVADFVAETTGHLDTAEASLLKLEEDPADVEKINAVFRAFHTIKGMSGFLDLKQIGALAHATETLLGQARKGNLSLTGGRIDLVLEARDAMKQLIGAVGAAAKSQQAPIEQPGLPELLDRLASAATGRIDAAEPALALPTAAPAVESDPAAQKSNLAPAPPPAAWAADTTVRVATTRLDTLIDTVGELVIAQAMVAQDLGPAAASQRLSRNLARLGKITRTLQDLSMAMRMVPIAGVFQKMARLARDTARKECKLVEFVEIGGETELDRNVVEAISDPLIHMVRNAIDHGLESPEERYNAGKPNAGRLTLKASHQSGSVAIEISDDGRGLPREKILAKARAAGIVESDHPLSDEQVDRLIFHPGLTTAEKVTDISGRGVGMDVVRKNVEALRGRIEIASTPGKGSTFTVRLPLTLAVIDGLIVKVGPQRFIVPITSIEQSLRPAPQQLSSVQGKGELCKVRDRLLPMVRLHSLFDIPPATEDPTKALVVIVQEGTDRCCLMVDELVGQQQVVIKSLGKEVGGLPGFAGCAILGDGNVSLILDVAGIILSALR